MQFEPNARWREQPRQPTLKRSGHLQFTGLNVAGCSDFQGDRALYAHAHAGWLSDCAQFAGSHLVSTSGGGDRRTNRVMRLKERPTDETDAWRLGAIAPAAGFVIPGTTDAQGVRGHRG